jgi:two-component sensor histidine kinase
VHLDIQELKESKAFLNDLYANVTTAIFLADEDARLAHFNDAFKALFYKPEDELIGALCGNAIGCSFVADEGLDCGYTSNCERCDLRSSIVRSFTEHVPVYKMPLIRDFDICGKRLRKHFSFTTKYASYQGEEYVLVLVDDVTELEQTRADLVRKNGALEATLRALAQELTDNSRELTLMKENSHELGRELRHRVGNTLQLLSSLLHYDTDGAAGANGAFKDFTLRLDTIIEAYSHTRYEEGDVKLPIVTFIKALTSKTDHCFCPNLDQVDESQMPIALEQAIPLGLAFMELVSIARRESEGRITVESHHDRRMLSIGIKAETSCFSPRNFSTRGEPESAISAHMKLASAMIEQLKGQLECRPDNEAWIRLPL